MRILSLSNCPLDEALGSGYVALRYAAGLRAAGHEVEALGPVDYEPWHGMARAISYRQALGMARAARRRLARRDYDVVEIWGGEGWLALSLLARAARGARGSLAARARRPLLVCHSNGLETHSAEILRAAEESGALPRSRRWFQRDQSALFARGFRAADALVTVAGFDRDYALRHGYAPPDRVLAIENPLPDSYLGLTVDFRRPPRIGYCGSWIPRKGIALLAAALPQALRALPEWRLVLVGVGDGFRAADHFPADVLPRIEVIPYAERGGRLREIYQGLSVLVLPSIYESFGLVAAEAMACGTAVVATRVGFAASLEDGAEAALLPELSAPALQAAVEALAGDEERRQRIARGGHARVQTLRWDQAVATLEAAYSRWLAEVRAGAGSTA